MSKKKEYVLKRAYPKKLGKEIGDTYNDEFGTDYEALIAKGVIEEVVEEKPAKPEKKEEKKPEAVVPPEPTEEPEAELSETEKVETRVIERIIEKEETGIAAFEKFTPEQVALIKRTIAKGATDDELMLFLSVCKSARINPFLRQAYYVKRWDSKEGKEVGAVQMGIDGFRAIAEGTGAYAGNSDPVFEGEAETEYKDKKGNVQGKYKHPLSATVTVKKIVQGVAFDFTHTARWSEFYPGDAQGFMWRNKPHIMLGKCAEAQALRKAFPKQLSALLTPEEMGASLPAGSSRENETDFQKAERMIKATTDAEGLNATKVLIKGSKKYTDGQKETLAFLIDERVKELTKGKDDQPAPEDDVPTIEG